MVVTSDIGDTTDIHPKNKQDVGLRFANIALVKHYKLKEEEVFGPLYKSFEVQKNKVIVNFEHSVGLNSKGKTLEHFEVAGEDGKFYPAQAKIEDDKVIALAKQVKKPVAIRYAWKNKVFPHLFNGAGLPASSFTSD